MSIIHTVVGLRLIDGGPSRSIPAVADAQASAGAPVQLVDTKYSRDASNGIPAVAQFRGVEGALCLGTLRSNPELSRILKLLTQNNRSTLFHDHGLWLPQNRTVAAVARELDCKFVVSPRGMLSAWSLNRRRASKLFVWHLWQKRALKRATGFHATSREEADDIRKAGFDQPIAVVPNGIAIPASLPQRGTKPGSPKRLLFLSRLHPVKGVKELLQAFNRASIPSDWMLSIVGPGESRYASEVKRLTQELALSDRVEFVGNVDDSEKWQHYVDADIFVLPSFSENFGIVIAEAMAAGLPVITTKGTPWQCIQDQNLGWWVPVDIQRIADALSEATSLPLSQLQQIGRAGAEYVRLHLSWDRSARDLLDFYHSL